MKSNFFVFIGNASFFIFIFLPIAILSIVSGIRIIKKKSAISVGRNSHFNWNKPVEIRGRKAEKIGVGWIIFGIILLIASILLIVGSGQQGL